MIYVLRKVAQFNIKYRKNGGPIIDICSGVPPEEVTTLEKRHSVMPHLHLILN